jgi:hypothetical protein
LGASTELRHNLRRGVREVSGIWWWYLILGVAWVWYGMFVLSYRVGSLTAVAGLVGVAFLFGGFGQLMAAGRAETWRWLFIVTGILGVAAGIMTFAWPDITLRRSGSSSDKAAPGASGPPGASGRGPISGSGTKGAQEGARPRPAPIDPALPQRTKEPSVPPDREGRWRESTASDLAVHVAVAATTTPTLDRVFAGSPGPPTTQGHGSPVPQSWRPSAEHGPPRARGCLRLTCSGVPGHTPRSGHQHPVSRLAATRWSPWQVRRSCSTEARQ